MRLTVNFVAAVAAIAAFVSAVSLPALAECKKYGFTVNDYGKDGPTKDAKSLLDKLIATKMTEKGIKDFHTGKKSVSCELFLNFIVFDEHTCTAEATVCWGGSPLPKSEQTAAVEDTKETTKSAEKTEKATKKKDVAKKTGSVAEKRKTAALHQVPDPKKPLEHAAAEEHPAAAESSTSGSAESETPATEAATSAPAPAAAKPVETGSLSETAKKPTKHHHAEHATSSADEAAPAKPAASGAGYPTPEPPQDDQ